MTILIKPFLNPKMRSRPGEQRTRELTKFIAEAAKNNNFYVVQLPEPSSSIFLEDQVHLKVDLGVIYYDSVLNKINSF